MRPVTGGRVGDLPRDLLLRRPSRPRTGVVCRRQDAEADGGGLQEVRAGVQLRQVLWRGEVRLFRVQGEFSFLDFKKFLS